MHAAKKEVLKKFPEAVCKKQIGRIFYRVQKEEGGDFIGGGFSAIMAWKNAMIWIKTKGKFGAVSIERRIK